VEREGYLLAQLQTPRQRVDVGRDVSRFQLMGQHGDHGLALGAHQVALRVDHQRQTVSAVEDAT
jgi:hypothetical protein